MSNADLLHRIDQHLARSGESASGFGRRVCGDPRLVADLREGRAPRARLAERILATLDPAPTGFAEAQAPFHAEAKLLGLDADSIAARAVQEAIRAEKARRWLEENREAIEAQNAWIEEHGLPLARHRMF